MDAWVLILLLVALVLLVAYVLVPALKELRHVRRRLALRRELEGARGAAVCLDPGRRVVPALGTRGRVADRDERTVPPLLSVRPQIAGLAGGTRLAPFPERLASFKAELAHRGASLDDLRIDR